MRLVGKNRLVELSFEKATQLWVSAWVDDVLNANWGSREELLSNYPNVERVNDTIFLFPVASSDHFIKTVICFYRKTVCVSELLIGNEL